MLIGLTGRICAGKGTVSDYLKEKGFSVYLTREEVTEEANRRGIDPIRENLIILGRNTWETEGTSIFIRRILEKSKIKNQRDVVIDALRNPGEVEYLKSLGGILIAVDAFEDIRYQRWLSRNRKGDTPDFKEFRRMDAWDYNEGTLLGYRVKVCMAMADFYLVNNSTLENFYAQLDQTYLEIMKGKVDK